MTSKTDTPRKESERAIKAIRHWLEKTVIGYNFCPFAKREFVRNSIDYQINESNDVEQALYQLLDIVHVMDQNDEIETSLLIFSKGFAAFYDYLDLLDMANQLLEREGYLGIYQIASFHPNYCFDGVDEDDASNYTNRSPYPILHILREQSLARVLGDSENSDAITERNIDLAREQGRDVFERILEQSFAKS